MLSGAHGAALTHAIWLEENRAVVEVAKGFRCHCYHNMAVWGGHLYWRVDVGQQTDVVAVVGAVEAAVAEVAKKLGRPAKLGGVSSWF